jgi:hypothetical protein
VGLTVKYDLPPVIPIHDKMAMARDAGYSWEEINSQVAARQQAAYQAGYTEHQVNNGLGYPSGQGLRDYLYQSLTRRTDGG